MVAMEPFTYKLFSAFFDLLDDLSMLLSQIESDTDIIWAAQIEPALYRHSAPWDITIYVK